MLCVAWLVAASLLYFDLSSSAPPRPVLKATPSEARIDQAIPDARLRMDLLVTLQTVKMSCGRNLFQFVATEAKKAMEQERKTAQNPTPQPPKAPDVQQSAPIPFRFYGYTSIVKQWPKRAFFLEGDAIYIAAEGELIKSRYKVIYIGVNSAVVEDTSTKTQHALPLVESM